jgi:hypothetical protein
LFLQQRAWSFADFRNRYLDHPVIGSLARRVIWSFVLKTGRANGIWSRDCLVDQEGKPIKGLADDTRWHPHDEPTGQVLARREWLEEQEVRQPFKQAHREVYLLTDAERQTATYSNRFAAHVIRQHQFSALCQEPGQGERIRTHYSGVDRIISNHSRTTHKLAIGVGKAASWPISPPAKTAECPSVIQAI